MVTKIGVALIGYGLAGSVFHAPLISATAGLELRAVVTGDPGRSRRAHHDLPAALVVPTLDALWSDPSDAKLAVVATPNQLHAPQAISAMEHGLHVVVDKPMALSTAEAAAMIATSDRCGRLLSVFHNRRYDNDFLLLQRLLEEDRLGGLRRLESRFERWRPELRPGSWREERPPDAGGGLLLDLGSHLIDQALCLLGPAQKVYSEMAVRRRGSLGDDDDFVALSFAGDRHAHLWMSSVTPAPGPRLRAWGGRGTFASWGLDPQEQQLGSGLRPGAPGYGEAAEGQFAELREGGSESGQRLRLPVGRYMEFYSLMAAAIRGETAVPVPPAAGVAVLSVVEAARRSAASGQPAEPI